MWRPREIRLVQVKTGFHPSFGSGLIKGDNPTPQVEHVSVFDQSGNISDLIKLDTNIDSVCLRFFSYGQDMQITYAGASPFQIPYSIFYVVNILDNLV
jgi:hypothetical protein